MSRSFLSIYVVLLGISLGVQVAAGAFIAPVIFHPEQYLGAGVLTHYQSGILMTQVFFKTNMLLGIVALYSIVFEVFALIKVNIKDVIALVLSCVAFALTATFLFYYTPFIVEAQNVGVVATTSEAFSKMHKQSEIVMKSLMVIQMILIFRRMGLKEQKA